jgi:hypothetical protein
MKTFMRTLAAAVCAAVAVSARQAPPPGVAVITASGLRGDVFFLAADEMRGRDALSVEGRIAANYIAAEFMRLGLKPIAAGTYFQTFPMTSATVDREHTSLVANWTEPAGGRSKHFQLGHDFNFSGQSNAPSSVTGPVLFAGYGVTAPEYGYDDFAGLDAAGKIVLILTHEPHETKEGGAFKGPWNTFHAYNRHKVENVRRHGAAGVLIVNEWTPHRPPMTPSAPRPGTQPSYALANAFLDIPVFTVSREAADEMLAPSGKTIEQLKDAIDASGKPASTAVRVQVTMTKALIDSKVVQTRNVVGLLEGADPQLRSDVVAVTAHYDHLGVSGGRIYHGADDNASGTAGVLEIARAFARGPARPKRSILFMVFEAEERGLLGAYQYALTPLVPLQQTVAVLNMDMIGRDEDSPTWNTHPADNLDGVNVIGTLYNPELRSAIERENAGVGLKLDYKTDADDREGWFARSDHFPFAERGVPMVLFNTGEHPDYHTENDTWDRLHYEKMEKIVRLIYLTAWNLANAQQNVKFVP